MPALTWVLLRWPNTVALCALDRQLRSELSLRAGYALSGLPSPRQRRRRLPPEWPFLLILAGVLFLYLLLNR